MRKLGFEKSKNLLKVAAYKCPLPRVSTLLSCSKKRRVNMAEHFLPNSMI
jgi:hypothetical protein